MNDFHEQPYPEKRPATSPARPSLPGLLIRFALFALLLAPLFPLSQHNYLLFHIIVEMLSIGVAITIFSIGWNTRTFARSNTWLVLACTLLVVAGIDLLHILTYKGMDILPGLGPNPSTQFWVAARYFHSAGFLVAALLLGSRRLLPAFPVLTGTVATGIVLIGSIAAGWFPDCFVVGKGLTLFKVASEYIVSGLLAGACVLFWRRREQFAPGIVPFLVGSLILSICAELSFTLYTDVYGFSNYLGHVFKVLALILVYRALIKGSLRYPYENLFADLVIAKEQAEEASRAKSEFLANMSHEIRTPMTVFLGALEHLEKIDQNPEHQRLLQMADKSARHLRELIDDILDFSRIEAGHVDIHQDPLEVRAWVEESVGMFRPLAREKNLKLNSHVADDVPAIIEADAIRLKQILTNLVGNAIKFTPQGEVNVTVETADDSLEFVVADTGIGIPEDKQDLLFQNFSQVDASFQRNYGGTGLGLAISRKLAELMGGRISVWSREGDGSRFTLTLPLKEPTRIKQESPDHSAWTPGDESSYRILLAEDDPMIRELFVMGLQQRGWHVEVATSGEKALEIWALRPFDVILMDLQMPGVDGLEATRQIRAKGSENGEHVCIIGVTAHAHRKIVEECFKVGMDEVLTKPLNPQKLEETILRCMGKEQC